MFPVVCSWVSLGMTGAGMGSPKEGNIAVLVSVRKAAACRGLGAELPQLPLRCIVWSHCQETGTAYGENCCMLLYLEDLLC